MVRYVMRRSDSEYLEVVVSTIVVPHREETKRRPKKRWIDGIKQDLEKLGIPNWEGKVRNREEWKEVSVTAKLLKSCDASERERKCVNNS
jgi:hypothetical protein